MMKLRRRIPIVVYDPFLTRKTTISEKNSFKVKFWVQVKFWVKVEFWVKVKCWVKVEFWVKVMSKVKVLVKVNVCVVASGFARWSMSVCVWLHMASPDVEMTAPMAPLAD